MHSTLEYELFLTVVKVPPEDLYCTIRAKNQDSTVWVTLRGLNMANVSISYYVSYMIQYFTLRVVTQIYQWFAVLIVLCQITKKHTKNYCEAYYSAKLIKQRDSIWMNELCKKTVQHNTSFSFVILDTYFSWSNSVICKVDFLCSTSIESLRNKIN